MPKDGRIFTTGAVCFVVFCCNLTIEKAYALAGSTAHNGSNAQAVHTLGETGEDVNVGLIGAANIRTTHEAFKDADGQSRAFNHNFTGSGTSISNHDTWVAGVVASRGGASHPNDIGVAPGVDIHSARVIDNNGVVYLTNALDGPDGLITKHNCRVIVTGFMIDSVSPNGQSQWTLLYDYYTYTYNVIFANASGKDYTYPIVFGDCYNGITTGGLVVTDPDVYLKVGTNSNIGPTVDGRRKPDLVAPSQNQTMPSAGSDTSWYEWTAPDGATSLSTPHTAGVAALLLGLADQTTNPDDNRNEVIKAVIVNSTFPNILDEFGNPTDDVWDTSRGYGRIDALRAYRLLDSNQVSTGVSITEEKGWAFNDIAPWRQHTYTIYAPERHRLVATLTWNRRVEWTDTLHPYLADLDLRIYKLNNPYPVFSKQIGGFNANDNLIKADFLLTSSGQYTLKVVNNSFGETAHYGLAFELLPPIQGDFDLDYIVDEYDLIEIGENWLQPTASSDIDLSKNGFIDFRDFALLAENWLITNPAYYQD